MQSLQQKKMENMRNIRRSYIRKLGVTHFLRLVHSPFRRSAAMQFFPIFCVLLCVLLVTGVNAFALPKSFRVFAGRNGDVTASRTARSPVTFGSTIQKISKMRAGASKSVTEIANQVQVAQLLKDTGKNKLIVADFTASWCPPCKMIAPIYQSMSEKFPNVVFTKVCAKRTPKNVLCNSNLKY